MAGSPLDDDFDTKVKNINDLYISAIERHQNGERTISIDEMTGIQATERLEKDLPMRPAKVERKEFEYNSSWYTDLDACGYALRAYG